MIKSNKPCTQIVIAETDILTNGMCKVLFSLFLLTLQKTQVSGLGLIV